MQLVPLQKKYFQVVLDLSNNAFGNSYLSFKYLEKYLNSEKHLGFIIKQDSQLVGFTLIDICNPSELKRVVLKDKDWFYEITKQHQQVAIIKQTVVNPEYGKQGIGSELVKLSINKVGSKIGLYLSTVWAKLDNNAMENILLKNGFHQIKTISNYWSDDSLEKNYDCTYCGNPPCKCSTQVYIKKKALIE